MYSSECEKSIRKTVLSTLPTGTDSAELTKVHANPRRRVPRRAFWEEERTALTLTSYLGSVNEGRHEVRLKLCRLKWGTVFGDSGIFRK